MSEEDKKSTSEVTTDVNVKPPRPERRVTINTSVDPSLLGNTAVIPEEEMTPEIKTMLENANGFLTAHNQMNLVKEKFKYDCMISVNGGTFLIDDNFIMRVKSKLDDEVSSPILLDYYGAPILILRLKEFYDTIVAKHKEAMNSYSYAYRKLQRVSKKNAAKRSLELS